MQLTIPDSMLISDRVAAALAGVSRAHWHRLRAAGKIPGETRLGRKVLYNRAEIVAWINLRCPDRKSFEAIRTMNKRRFGG